MNKQEIEQAFEDLKKATLDMFVISQTEDTVKQEKIKCREALRIARETVNSIEF